MRFAENNRISHRQLYRQMNLAFLSPFLLCLFGRGKINGLNGVIGTAAALIILGFYIIFLIRLTPYCENLRKISGFFMEKLTGVFFLIYIILTGGYLLSLLGQIVPVSLITGVSDRWICLWAILACSVGTHRGMQKRGRMAEVSGGLLLGGVVLMLILCAGQAKTEYLKELADSWNWQIETVWLSGYGLLCAFSGLSILPFALEDVEKYSSAGKTVAAGIFTVGGVLLALEFLLPAVLGYDRVRMEKYPVLPLLDGADLPGNVLARFDVLWMGFLLYGLLFSIGSLLHYGHQIIKKSHLGTGRVWMAAAMYLVAFARPRGYGIQEYFGNYVGYIFVPFLLLIQIWLFVCGKKKHDRKRNRKKTAAAVSALLVFCLGISGCAAAVEPEKRSYPLALGVDESADGLSVIYGMPDLSESTGQGKEEEDGGLRALKITGEDFNEIEEQYDRSQEKFLDVGHLQVLILGKSILESGRWKQVLEYLRQEPFVGEDLYIFEAESAEEVLKWRGENNSSVGEYLAGLVENRMSEKKIYTVTLREVYHEWYRKDEMPALPEIHVSENSLECT